MLNQTKNITNFVRNDTLNMQISISLLRINARKHNDEVEYLLNMKTVEKCFELRLLNERREEGVQRKYMMVKI